MGHEKSCNEETGSDGLNSLHKQNKRKVCKSSYLPFNTEQSSAIIAVTDRQGIIQYANTNFCKISKYSLDELAGFDHRIINSGYHSKEFFQELWTSISGGRIWKGEIRNRAKDGSLFWLDTTIIPFLDQDGSTCQYVAIRSDITARKKAEEDIKVLNRELEKKVNERTEEMDKTNKELEFQRGEKADRADELMIANEELLFQNREKENRAAELLEAIDELRSSECQVREINRELESFSYSVSHDLRAPLRAIHGYSQMLKSNFEDVMDNEANRLVNVIVNNTKKMGQLIDDLLEFSRMGRKELNKVEMTMDSIVANICGDLQKEQAKRKIIFNTGSLLPGLADNILIKNVWQNLISNAVKYTGLKDTAIIEIGSVQTGHEVVYHVKDNGAGFDMRYSDKLFGVFQRLHSEDEFEGTGVGLALAQKIIIKHGGRIWATAEVDQGACFYFTLNSVNS